MIDIILNFILVVIVVEVVIDKKKYMNNVFNKYYLINLFNEKEYCGKLYNDLFIFFG